MASVVMSPARPRSSSSAARTSGSSMTCGKGAGAVRSVGAASMARGAACPIFMLIMSI
ncbi:Uncharacterised protein [Bordetella pertussis]|nr:Uncharacterised protein [Bordetella pertussis]CFW49542.1 Uncharacterised protein [Bordetella pertussis]